MYQYHQCISHVTDEMTSCEILVTEALSSPLVRAMMRGLEEAGCPLNIPRHVVCEPCNNSLAGGWVKAFN